MTFLHPFSKYGLALILQQENIESIESIMPEMARRYIEDGLNHFRLTTDNNPELDEILQFRYITKQEIESGRIKKSSNRAFYLTPNIITSDLKAHNSWKPISKLLSSLSSTDRSVFNKTEKITMGIAPIAGELNNGTKSKKNSTSSLLEVACCAITNTTTIKPSFATREKGRYIPTAIIPDLDLVKMKDFIQLYHLMLNTTVDQSKLFQKKVFRKEGKVPDFSKLRPPIYNGNFPYAPRNSAFGIVSLLGAIGRWSKEAGYTKEGQKVLESLKNTPLYIIQYGYAQSVTFDHYIIDLAKENKLSDIVSAIQSSAIVHPFDESKSEHRKGVQSRRERFYLFSSRFLQLFNKPALKDFLSVRAEYSNDVIALFDTFFLKQMKITKEVVRSVRALGLWLNYVAYWVGNSEVEALKENASEDDKKTRDSKVAKIKQKTLVELESSVFGARKPAEMLNVIVRAGRLSGRDAPPESDLFTEAVLIEEIELDDAKSMLMAYARTRNHYERDKTSAKEEGDTETTKFMDPDVAH